MRAGCRPGEQTMSDIDWAVTYFPARCRFYPGRDCPGWAPGGTCQRVGVYIAADHGSAVECGPGDQERTRDKV